MSAVAVYQELLGVDPIGEQNFYCAPIDINITMEPVKALDQAT